MLNTQSPTLFPTRTRVLHAADARILSDGKRGEGQKPGRSREAEISCGYEGEKLSAKAGGSLHRADRRKGETFRSRVFGRLGVVG